MKIQTFLLNFLNCNMFSACVYAVFVQEHVTKLIGLKRSYQLGLGIFALSMAVTVLNTSRYVFTQVTGVGVVYKLCT